MSFEVVYTSARRGLRDGASGFCTVAATEGIPRPLHEKMESLSGYRHPEANAGGEPPVNHSHVTVRIQRTLYHVLSRIGDAGIDYTGRTNKIGHHLALTADEAERFPQGPECMFSDHAFWYADWDGDPQALQRGRTPNVYSAAVNDFDTWQAVLGDAGWAGVLGQAVADGMKPVSIIVPPNEDTMAMLHEAMQLVPPHLRWRVCFSTYFSRAAPGTQCHWRFILDGSSEARKLRARSPGLLVDPHGSTGEPPDGNLFVEAAREGNPSKAHAASKSNGRGRSTVSVSSGGGGGARRRSGQIPRHPAAGGSGSGARRRQRPQIEYVEEYDEGEDERRPRKRSSKPKTGVWLVFTLLFAVVAILAYFGIKQLS